MKILGIFLINLDKKLKIKKMLEELIILRIKQIK